MVSPCTALGLVPGVIVNVHVPEAGRFEQVDVIVVPDGSAGDTPNATDNAGSAPTFVIVIMRALPVSWGFRPGLFTESARLLRLAVIVVDGTGSTASCAVTLDVFEP